MTHGIYQRVFSRFRNEFIGIGAIFNQFFHVRQRTTQNGTHQRRSARAALRVGRFSRWRFHGFVFHVFHFIESHALKCWRNAKFRLPVWKIMLECQAQGTHLLFIQFTLGATVQPQHERAVPISPGGHFIACADRIFQRFVKQFTLNRAGPPPRDINRSAQKIHHLLHIVLLVSLQSRFNIFFALRPYRIRLHQLPHDFGPLPGGIFIAQVVHFLDKGRIFHAIQCLEQLYSCFFRIPGRCSSFQIISNGSADLRRQGLKRTRHIQPACKPRNIRHSGRFAQYVPNLLAQWIAHAFHWVALLPALNAARVFFNGAFNIFQRALLPGQGRGQFKPGLKWPRRPFTGISSILHFYGMQHEFRQKRNNEILFKQAAHFF